MGQAKRRPGLRHLTLACVSPMVLAATLSAGGVAYAQTAVTGVPAGAPAGEPNVVGTSPIPHIAPVAPPSLGAGLPNFAPLNAGAALPNVVIFVHSVSVIGATAFPADKLNGLTAGLAGQTVPLAKIEASRRAILDLYRAHGFILTTVSMDISAQGDVRMIVTEGRIVAVKLSSDIGPAGSLVLGFLDHVMEQKPVSEAALERWLLLASQVPGVSVHAVLQADSSDPGALTLVAEVSRQAVGGLVTADNRSLKGTGPDEGLAVLDVNSETALGEQTEFSLFHTSGSTDNFGQVAESFFIGTHGLHVRLYAGFGRANPGGLLRQVDYASRTDVFGAALTYPVVLTRNQSLEAGLRFDGVDGLIDTSRTRTSADSVRSVRATVQYAFEDLWAGDQRDALTVVNAIISQGVPAFGDSANHRTAPPAGRGGADFTYFKLNGSIGRTQTLFAPFDNATVALRLEAGGQYSNVELPSAEQFCLGGSRYTRGFYSCEAVGDKAAYATAELQYNTGYDFSVRSQDIELGTQLYMFYDWGESYSNLPTDLNHRLSSYGGGVRLGLTRNLELDVEAARRLTTQLSPASTGTPALADTAIYWGVTARF